MDIFSEVDVIHGNDELPDDLIERASIDPAGPVVVGSTHTYRLTLVIGRRPPVKGTVFEVVIPIGWTPPTKEKGRPGSISWSTTASACLLAEVVRRRHVRLNMTGGEFKPGDEIVLVYGDNTVGEAGVLGGATGQKWVVDFHPRFEVRVDNGGFGRFLSLHHSPTVWVVPDEAVYLHVCVPSIVTPGEEFTVRFRPLDRFGNAVRDWNTRPEDTRVSCRGLTTLGWSGPDSVRARFDVPGLYYVDVEVKNPASGRTLSGVSNPCLVTAEDVPRLFWGDLHVHSTMSDGAGSPQFCYEYAKNVSMLDFAAVTDHDFELYHAWFTRKQQVISDEAWRQCLTISEQHTTPLDFVAIPAYEWTGRPHGDRCVYFLEASGTPIFRCQDERFDTPEKLWRALESVGPDSALTVPHSTTNEFMGCNWSSRNDRLETLVEIYSMHGSSECLNGLRPVRGEVEGRSVRDALAKGYRLGFVAGGDMHSSQPGNPLLAEGPYSTLRYRAGLTAVLCKEKTREAIFRSMKARRCYATTGDRILLSFTVNGVDMGGEVRLREPDALLRIRLRVAGTSALRKVEIIRDGDVFEEYAPGDGVTTFSTEVQHRNPVITGKSWSYYYLRVVQDNGEMAWSSPVWVVAPGDTGGCQMPNEEHVSGESRVTGELR